MVGGAGDDTYVVDAAGDQVVEQGGAGTDTVKSTITLALTDNVENLILQGTLAINGTGNPLNNELIGNSASNALIDDAGDDTLLGGAGNDLLSGGSGNDVIDGGEGTDTVVFLGNRVEYALTGTPAEFSAVDQVPDRDGANVVRGVELIQFADGTFAVEDLLNRAPFIGSNGGGDTATVIVAENSTAVTTVSATDPNGETPTFAIVGGADADFFAIDSNTGALTFNQRVEGSSPSTPTTR